MVAAVGGWCMIFESFGSVGDGLGLTFVGLLALGWGGDFRRHQGWKGTLYWAE